MPFEAALDDLLDLADTMYEWCSPYLQTRTTAGHTDLGLLTRILGWAALVERTGDSVQPDRWDHRDRLVDGTLQLNQPRPLMGRNPMTRRTQPRPRSPVRRPGAR